MDQNKSMSEFLRALSSFRNGALSSQGLLAEIDRQLALHMDDAVTMLAQLDEEHARSALPDGIHDAVSGRILRSLEVSGDLSAPSRAFPSDDATQWLRDPDASVTLLAEAEEPMRAVQWPLASSGEHSVSVPRSVPRKNASPAEGSVLKHRFKLVECVGEGGMGRVYKAIDLRRVEARQTDIHVAVKVLTRSFRDYSGSLAALQSEATKLQRLMHPNIVRVIDVDRDGQTVFMTMEYLSGLPLKRMLQAPPSDGPHRGMPRAVALPILERMADALSYAHRNDIVHGDLKPSNVIVTDDGEVKVIDFGIARMMASSRHPGPVKPGSGSESESLSGLTPSYASPEMLEQHHPADPRDDIYALACIAHEMLTGEHPFDRSAATAARDSGLKLRRRRTLTRTQYKALANGLQFDRDRRTPSVARFMQELRGDRAASVRRTTAYAALAIAVVAVGAYFLTRARPETASARLTAGDIFRDCPTCPLMKVLPVGQFAQGSANDEAGAEAFEQPKHTVMLARPVGFGVQEVTRAQYAMFIEETKHKGTGCATYDGEWTMRADLDWSHVGYRQTASHPVTCVSWQDAEAYTAWLSNKTGRRYRLPTASEWEYAARGGTTASRPWGESTKDACAAANVADEAAAQRFPGWTVHACNDSYVFTAPVGAFSANAFGLNDLFGNVFEWVQDCWHENYQGAPTNGAAWVEAGCKQRELRGGSWFTTPDYVRAAYRNRFEPDYRSNSVGFRVVRDMHE
jgi:formylglycine-generating enzyme required for sulfatase activity/tRNA A-37 threonylcarbamoyl transferase component Bud32